MEKTVAHCDEGTEINLSIYNILIYLFLLEINVQ